MERWEAMRVTEWDSSRRVLVLTGVHVLNPETGKKTRQDVMLKDGHVKLIAAGDHPDDAMLFDLSGKIVVPGLVDMHVHLREPGDEDAETIASGTAAAARGGFVAVASMANTKPPIDDPQSVRFVLERARQAGMCRVYPMAAVSQGLEGKQLTEMFDLAEAGAIGFSDDGKTIMDANLMRRALQYASMLNKVIVVHAEDLHLKAEGVAHEGYMATKLGLKPIPRAAEEVIVARDIRLVELAQGRLHVAHVSCGTSVAMIQEAQQRGLRVTGEVTPHHLLLNDTALETYDPRYKMAPPLREESDCETLLQGIKSGVIQAIATDHAPHTEIDKDAAFDEAPNGVVGVETAFAALYTGLVKPGKLELARLVYAMSLGPARVLDLEHGPVREGGAADLTVLDLDATWTVRAEEFVGRSANSPWLGQTLQGLPIMTVAGGRVLYHHPAVGTSKATGMLSR
jgi:dihydroorotase